MGAGTTYSGVAQTTFPRFTSLLIGKDTPAITEDPQTVQTCENPATGEDVEMTFDSRPSTPQLTTAPLLLGKV